MNKITSKIKRTSIWAQLDQARCDTNNNIWDQVDLELWVIGVDRIVIKVNNATLRSIDQICARNILTNLQFISQII